MSRPQISPEMVRRSREAAKLTGTIAWAMLPPRVAHALADELDRDEPLSEESEKFLAEAREDARRDLFIGTLKGRKEMTRRTKEEYIPEDGRKRLPR